VGGAEVKRTCASRETGGVTPARIEQPRMWLRRADARFRTLTEWSDTRHSFSFGSHYDPDDVGFGALMVHNEDRVRAGRGYADHPHRDAEIITWVLSGSLVHVDSTGHRGVVHRGLVQRLSAGAGVIHAERNDAYRLDPSQPETAVHFVQMWVRPDESGVVPTYEQRAVPLEELGRQWLPVVSGHRAEASIGLGSRASTLWVTTLVAGERRVLPDAPRLHLFVATGTVTVGSVGELVAGDALRLLGDTPGSVTAVVDAELLVWELAE
jgi:redox-sensitive bicupin YhaK (pirin superfamily)